MASSVPQHAATDTGTEADGWKPAIPDAVRTGVYALALLVGALSPLALVLGVPSDIVAAASTGCSLLAGGLGVAYNPSALQVRR